MQHSQVSFRSISYLILAPNPFDTPFLPMLLRTSCADEARMATIFVYLAVVMKEMGQKVTSSTLLRRRSPIRNMNTLEQRPFLAQVSPGGTCWVEHASLTTISPLFDDACIKLTFACNYLRMEDINAKSLKTGISDSMQSGSLGRYFDSMHRSYGNLCTIRAHCSETMEELEGGSEARDAEIHI